MKAYISCELSTKDSTKKSLTKKLEQMGYTVTLYEKGTVYSDKDLREADLVVLVSQKYQFIENLTRGCKQEIRIAADMNKLVCEYIGYEIYKMNSVELKKGNIQLGEKLEKIIHNTYALY